MQHGKRLITLLLVAVLLNPSRIVSRKVQKPRGKFKYHVKTFHPRDRFVLD